MADLRKELMELVVRYGATLRELPHPKFSGKSLRDHYEYIATRGTPKMMEKELSKLRRKVQDMTPSASDGFIIAYGKTYDLNEKFKQYGFSLKKLDTRWVWYKEILSDKYWYWQQAVEGFGAGISAIFVKSLSDFNQAVEESVKLDRENADPNANVLESHELDGKVFEVKKWYAMKFKDDHNTQYAFRNFRILKVLKETQRAYMVDAEFFSGIASCCGVCGQQLNNDISRATGIGPICAGKIGLPRPTMAAAKEIVAELEKKSKAQGTFKGVWIPKSQIKNITDVGGKAA